MVSETLRSSLQLGVHERLRDEDSGSAVPFGHGRRGTALTSEAIAAVSPHLRGTEPSASLGSNPLGFVAGQVTSTFTIPSSSTRTGKVSTGT